MALSSLVAPNMMRNLIVHHTARLVSLPLLLSALSLGLLYERLAAIYSPPMVHQPPTPDVAALPHREDARLFEQALAVGLLRPGADGRLAVAPADLPLRQTYQREHPELLAPRHDAPDWLDGPWDDAVRRLHRALHFSAAGRYVRQQIDLFNAQRSAPGRQEPIPAPPGGRQIQWVGAGLRAIQPDQ